ncbi:MAG: hypothetical protein ACK57P_20115, partial [Planctomycetota bacterium]
LGTVGIRPPVPLIVNDFSIRDNLWRAPTELTPVRAGRDSHEISGCFFAGRLLLVGLYHAR